MKRDYTRREKRVLAAKIVEVVIRTTFSSHIYAFKNTTYKQKAGGAIGLRLMGVVARILMDRWSDLLLNALEENGIQVRMIKKYVDDVNVVADALPRGCYWEQDLHGKMRLTWSEQRLEEDNLLDKCNNKRTMNLVAEIANTLMAGFQIISVGG